MTIINPLPYNINNGDPIDATPVMADFNQIVTNVNNNAADLHAQNTFSQPQNGVAAILPAQMTILSQVQALLSAAVPTGTLLDFAGTAAPAGWLICDGSAVSRTTYALLFTAIGTTWGAGDGVSTFNIPNMQRSSSIGSGGTGTGVVGNVVGNGGGAETHTISIPELPSHNHGINDPTHTHSVNDPGHGHGFNDPGHAHSVNDPGHAHSYTAPGTGLQNSGSFFTGLATQGGTTSNNGSNIGIFANFTGASVAGGGSNISLFGNATGITTQATGSGGAMNIYHPVRVVTKMIRTGL